jgi:hypothetical protein
VFIILIQRLGRCSHLKKNYGTFTCLSLCTFPIVCSRSNFVNSGRVRLTRENFLICSTTWRSSWKPCSSRCYQSCRLPWMACIGKCRRDSFQSPKDARSSRNSPSAEEEATAWLVNSTHPIAHGNTHHRTAIHPWSVERSARTTGDARVILELDRRCQGQEVMGAWYCWFHFMQSTVAMDTIGNAPCGFPSPGKSNEPAAPFPGPWTWPLIAQTTGESRGRRPKLLLFSSFGCVYPVMRTRLFTSWLGFYRITRKQCLFLAEILHPFLKYRVNFTFYSVVVHLWYILPYLVELLPVSNRRF